MSLMLRVPTGDGETGLPGDSLLQAIVNDSAVMARHPPITRGTMRGVSL